MCVYVCLVSVPVPVYVPVYVPVCVLRYPRGSPDARCWKPGLLRRADVRLHRQSSPANKFDVRKLKGVVLPVLLHWIVAESRGTFSVVPEELERSITEKRCCDGLSEHCRNAANALISFRRCHL